MQPQATSSPEAIAEAQHVLRQRAVAAEIRRVLHLAALSGVMDPEPDTDYVSEQPRSLHAENSPNVIDPILI